MPKARRGGSGSMRQRLQAQLAKKLSFTRYDSAFIRVSDKGSVCTCVKAQPSTAVVSLPVMSTGRHYAEFTLVAGLKGTVGVCRAGLFDPESTAGGVMATNWGWGFVALAGDGDHSQQQYRWKGQRGSAQPPRRPRTVSPPWADRPSVLLCAVREGETVGLVLDMGAGTLDVYADGERLGTIFSGLIGEFSWFAQPENSVGSGWRIQPEKTPPEAPPMELDPDPEPGTLMVDAQQLTENIKEMKDLVSHDVPRDDTCAAP